MRHVLASLLITLAATANAQCEYRVREADTFTGDKRVITRAAISFGLSAGFWFEFRQVGESYFLDVNWAPAHASIIDGSELVLKFVDGTLARYTASGTAFLQYQGNTSSVQPTYLINGSDVSKLASVGISDFRFYTADGYVDYSLSEKVKAQEKIMRAAHCLLVAP